jgi:exopolysaccharide production protein ExoQ
MKTFFSDTSEKIGAPEFADDRIPWWIFIILTILLFFILGHDFAFSLNKQIDAPGEVFVEMVEEGNPLRRGGLAILGVFMLILLYRQGIKSFVIIGFLGWAILFLVFWDFFSITWSIDKTLTARRLLILAVFSLSAITLSGRYPIKNLVYFALFSSGLFLFLGYLSELTLGTFTPFASGYRFIGTVHPNVQGENSAIMLISAIAIALVKNDHRKRFFTLAIIALLSLILTKSRTSFAASIIAITLLITLSTPMNLKKLFILLCSSLFLLLIAFIFFNYDQESLSFISSGINLGRDVRQIDTFNGRMRIWNLCLESIYHRPLHGYGYEGFWTLPNVTQFSYSIGWGIKSAHSAYLELLLSTGLIGMITFLSVIIIGLTKSLVYFKTDSNPSLGFLFSISVFFLIQGLLESRFAQLAYGAFLMMWGFAFLGFRRLEK